VTPRVVGGPPQNGDGQPGRRRVRSEGVPLWPVLSVVIVVVLLTLLILAIVLLIVYG
jgi:hypothetical protein